MMYNTENIKDCKFHLPENFIKQFRGKQPDWGPLGYITYKRTYARRIEGENRTEEFFETIKRVVEGEFSLQKEHCYKLGLPWKEKKAQYSAQITYKKMWDFKFLPPGRGLWIMGTKFVDKNKGACLNNCGFTSTEDINIKGSIPFIWCMDALMLGVGVGFDTKGAGKIQIHKPKYDHTIFQIPDTREGWVESLRYVLDGFFFGKNIPILDYSLIRPAGLPIKGFGGISSGPDPLKLMNEEIISILYARSQNENYFITSSDIVDIFDLIGKTVVSGNVRRSALLGLGDINDKEFINLKQDPELLKSHRWASNNSIIANIGDDYKPIIKLIRKNGEPGIVWLKNTQDYSRMGRKPDFKDKKAKGTNPCFSGDTLIAVADGRGAVSIKQLTEEGNDIPVYSINPEGMVEIQMGRNPRITGYDEKLIKIILEDRKEIIVTPNHKMILLNGDIVEARDLKKGDSLPRFTKNNECINKGGKRYLRVSCNTNNIKKNKIFEHRLIAKFNNIDKWNQLYDEKVKNGFLNNGGIVVHHKDENGLNNSIDNLEIKLFSDHNREHGRYDVIGEKNPMYGKKHSDNTKKLIGIKSKERYKDPEYKQMVTNAVKKGMDNDRVRKILSDSRKKTMIKFYKEFEQKTDLETVWIDDKLYIKKKCETCNNEMILQFIKREISFCSATCAANNKIVSKKRKEKQKEFFEKKQQKTLHNQIMIFKDLKEKLKRIPMKKEWEQECKLKKVTYRTNPKSSNPYVLMNFKDLKKRAEVYNHRVLRIEKLNYTENVYNITVDKNHTVGIITTQNDNRKSMDGIFTLNCGEQTLFSGELCCLVETFPSRHESYEEYEETLKYAYLYAKSVTLLNTQWEVTNAVMNKNRRIGTSQSGIIDAFVKHGRREILRWCDKGYNFLLKEDKIYSDWLGIPLSIKITSVKPSGTVSLLPGVSPGIHYPHSEYYIRRIRMAKNSPLIKIIKNAGYYYEEDYYSETSYVVEFPIHEMYFDRSKKDVSIWEQFENAAAYQQHWSDNQVSITITFKDEEAKDIEYCLEAYEDKLKGVSLLPLNTNGYKQLPYEEISREEYEDMISKIKPLIFDNVVIETKRPDGCTTDQCLLKQEFKDIEDSINIEIGESILVS